jgi:CBS domain-containing protein
MDQAKGILIKDIMTEDVATVTPETSLLEASQKMMQERYNGLPVVDVDNVVVGIVTEYDLLSKGTSIHLPTFIKLFGSYSGKDKKEQLLGEQLGDIMGFTVKDVMNTDPLVMHEDDSLTHVVNQFSKHHRVNPIPIIDMNGKLIGIVSRFDVIKYYASVLAQAGEGTG